MLGGGVNARPSLLRAAVLSFPFLNPLRAMMDPSLPLTAPEYAEWGNPADDAAARDAMLAYDPYLNLRRAEYPAMLLRTSMADMRVPYWMPLKYAARLRALRTDSRPTLMRVFGDVMHSDDLSGSFEERALDFAFLESHVQRVAPIRPMH